MIKYIGSKRTLLPTLVGLLGEFRELSSVGDVFSGTSRVGHALKKAGWRVDANDHNAYAHCLAQCYVEADREDYAVEAERLIDEFNRMKGSAGYFTETFCVQSRFFQPHNGERVDAIRDEIERKSLDPVLKSVVLTSLMEAADRVDSTCGLQMAYVKKWATRAYKEMELRLPNMVPRVSHGRCRAARLDANEFVRGLETDVAYIDPPYNQHSYLANYHIWESLVLWDRPEVYGVACKRLDCRERKSAYNSKPKHVEVFTDLARSVRSPLIVVSFNNEGYQSRPQMEALLSELGTVFVVTKDFKRYVGAQIGVYNPSGDRVGDVSHLRNEEYIYLVAKPELSDLVDSPLERLSQISARLDEAVMPQRSVAGTVRSEYSDRVSIVRQALAGSETVSHADLLVSTGLSDYQARMAIEALVGRGEASVVRTRVYQLGDSGVLGGRGLEVSVNSATRAPLRPGETLAETVVRRLKEGGSLSSAELQAITGGTAAELRAVLRPLCSAGVLSTTGQRRGMRYALCIGDGGVSAPVAGGSGNLRSPGPDREGVINALRGASRSSEELQRRLGGNAAALRTVLEELRVSGVVCKSGARRGTRYSLSDAAKIPASAAPREAPSVVEKPAREDGRKPKRRHQTDQQVEIGFD